MRRDVVSTCTCVLQVGYNIAGWLNKNKDPINDTLVQVLQGSKEHLVHVLFAEPSAGTMTSSFHHSPPATQLYTTNAA